VKRSKTRGAGCIQRSGKKDPKLEEILEAFIRPTVKRSSIGKPKDGKHSQIVWTLSLSERARKSKRFFETQFEPLVDAMDAALMKRSRTYPVRTFFGA